MYFPDILEQIVLFVHLFAWMLAFVVFYLFIMFMYSEQSIHFVPVKLNAAEKPHFICITNFSHAADFFADYW